MSTGGKPGRPDDLSLSYGGGRPARGWTDRTDLHPLQWWDESMITEPPAFVSDDLANLMDDADGDDHP